MARFDVFPKTIMKLGASGMTLRSGENIILHFSSGDRSAVQRIGHSDLGAMVDEVAPPEAQAALYMERPAVFEIPWGGSQWSLSVSQEGGLLTVVITRAPPAADAGSLSAEPAPFPVSQEFVTPRGAMEGPALPEADLPPPALADDRADFGSLVQGNTMEPCAPEPRALEPFALEPFALEPSALEPSMIEPTALATPVGQALGTRGGQARGSVPGLASQAASVAPSSGGVSVDAALPMRADSPAVSAAALPAASGLIVRLLRQMQDRGASDLHLCSGASPYFRLHGEMRSVEGIRGLSPEALFAEILAIMPPRNQEEFARRNDSDFAYEIPGLSRYRVNVFRDRFGPGTVIRAIPYDIMSPEALGLPREVLRLCYLSKGLVLVCGPTGSGKSTTLATLIDYINRLRSDHIITIEDPIEFVHENKMCLVNQREVHLHTDSFKDALRAALREDPDIVLVGEMRDLETIAIAVETAETGHLVFGTLHTTTAPSTVDRVIDQFPADRQEQIRQMLAESLKGVIAQNLCRRVGGGRVAAYEILIANRAVANLIRERKTFQLQSLMQTGRASGMRTLNDSLMDLVRRGLVEPLEAYTKAEDKLELRNLLQREGHPLELPEDE